MCEYPFANWYVDGGIEHEYECCKKCVDIYATKYKCEYCNRVSTLLNCKDLVCRPYKCCNNIICCDCLCDKGVICKCCNKINNHENAII
jgi:hypothetical protein